MAETETGGVEGLAHWVMHYEPERLISAKRFDFDRTAGQAGATRISVNFIQNLMGAAKIIDDQGRTVASDTECCRQK